jgi:hypothetical protein
VRGSFILLDRVVHCVFGLLSGAFDSVTGLLRADFNSITGLLSGAFNGVAGRLDSIAVFSPAVCMGPLSSSQPAKVSTASAAGTSNSRFRIFFIFSSFPKNC